MNPCNKIIQAIENGATRPDAIAKFTRIRDCTVRYHLRTMSKKKMVSAAGTTTNRTYSVAKPVKLSSSAAPQSLSAPKSSNKSVLRESLQDNMWLNFAAHNHRPKPGRALCLPGPNPDQEAALMRRPFLGNALTDVVMVERTPGKTRDPRVIEGEAAEILREKGREQPFDLVDLDLCTSLCITDFLSILEAIDHGYVADIFCLRINTCLRSGKRVPKTSDLDMIEQELTKRTQLLSKSAARYRGSNGKGPTMYITQWILKRGAHCVPKTCACVH